MHPSVALTRSSVHLVGGLPSPFIHLILPTTNSLGYVSGPSLFYVSSFIILSDCLSEFAHDNVKIQFTAQSF